SQLCGTYALAALIPAYDYLAACYPTRRHHILPPDMDRNAALLVILADTPPTGATPWIATQSLRNPSATNLKKWPPICGIARKPCAPKPPNSCMKASSSPRNSPMWPQPSLGALPPPLLLPFMVEPSFIKIKARQTPKLPAPRKTSRTSTDRDQSCLVPVMGRE